MNCRAKDYLLGALLALSLALMLFTAVAKCLGAQRASQPFEGTKMKAALPPYPWDTNAQSLTAAVPVAPITSTTTVKLTWYLTGWTSPDVVTGLEGSNDLIHWTQETVQPVPCRYTVTNKVWTLLPQTFTNMVSGNVTSKSWRAFVR